MTSPSWYETIELWFAQHGVLGFLLMVAVGAGLILLTLMAASGCVYWALFVRRLCRKENRNKFVEAPIPGLLRGKLAGQEFELAAARAETEAIQFARRTLEELSFRLENAEATLQKLENAWERLEDVGGRA